MSSIFRCIRCSYAVHGNRRPPWACPCNGEYEEMKVMGYLPAPAPPGVHLMSNASGGREYIWYRSWRGDFGWEAGSEIQWMVRIPPPDQAEFVDFIEIGKRGKGLEAGHCVSCPTCKARAGIQCVRPSEHQAFGKWTHSSRRDKADAVFFWQHGAGARFDRDQEGNTYIVPGENRDEERVRLKALWRKMERTAALEQAKLNQRTNLHETAPEREEPSSQLELFH